MRLAIAPLFSAVVLSLGLAACGTSEFTQEDQIAACIEMMDDNAPSGGISEPVAQVEMVEDIATITVSAKLDEGRGFAKDAPAQVSCIFRGARQMHFNWVQPSGAELLK